MEEMPLVTILMATYNGSKYLLDQLESILAQDYQNWELIIRDDRSTDETQSIISAYVNKDNRIKQIKFGDLHGSACRNFSQLFDWAYKNNKECVMFADQDDIWLSDKVNISIFNLQKEENLYGKNIPLAKYARFKFIDEENKEINKSLKLPDELDLKVLLNENYAWGCTLILNLVAIRFIKHIPAESVNHDYYIALVVSAFGRISLIDKELVLYRQHQDNVSGNVEKMSLYSRYNRYFKDSSIMVKPLTENYSLVQSFYNRYYERLSIKNKNMIFSFLEAYKVGFLKLLRVMIKFGILKIGLGKNVAYIYTLFLFRKLVIDNIYNSSEK